MDKLFKLKENGTDVRTEGSRLV
ncbi:hypothetical protein CGSSp14BS69_07705 [Streptococcus pneumoniae SP14-BS69]|nr:hypothetical protein CGSSp14BS69_07705 [Streptococcus pneumoniae SP14-BS69]